MPEIGGREETREERREVMSMSFGDWSKERLLTTIGVKMPNGDWQKTEYWLCKMGTVEKGEGSWFASVYVEGVRGQIVLTKVKGEFDSAAVAMGVVERVWKREEEKRNGNGH